MKTEIVCIIDRSGSMQAIRQDAIGGFNQFLEAQKAVPGEALSRSRCSITNTCSFRTRFRSPTRSR